MNETITLTWWHGLLMCAGGATILYMLFFAFVGIVGIISDKIDEWTGKKKKREDIYKEIELNFFRSQLFDMCKQYDDRHRIRYGKEGSAFNWIFKKYSLDELKAMDREKYFLTELFTKEELERLYGWSVF